MERVSPLRRIEQAGFLHDGSRRLPRMLDLPAGLVFDRLPTKRMELTFLISQRVPNPSPGLADGDVDVRAHRALVHVAVAGAEIAHDLRSLVR
jgi:hypothetical protein